jgi:hypothetical protein
MAATFELTVLRDDFVVCRLESSASIPQWVLDASSFVSVTRTGDELSIVCREQDAPHALASPFRWRALKVHGPFSFETIGVLSTLSHVLASANVSLLAMSTHDTDYLFVRSGDLTHAVRSLRHAGHTVHIQ